MDQANSPKEKEANLNELIAKRAEELGLPIGKLADSNQMISPTQLENQVKNELLKQYSEHLK